MDEASSAGNPFDQVAACGVWPRRGGTLRLDLSKKKRKESLPPQVYNEVIGDYIYSSSHSISICCSTFEESAR